MNAISKLPFAVKLVGLLCLLWLIGKLLSSDSAKQTDMDTDVHRSSDYAMTDFTMTIMNEFGKPARVVSGKEMSHYPKDDSTEIIDPVADFISEGNDTWLVESKHGHTQGKGESILLTGNVIITNKDNPDFKLLTERLTLDTVNNTAYTEEAVTILSPQGETNSVGLHAALKDETINLHSRVRGHYDAPPAQ